MKIPDVSDHRLSLRSAGELFSTAS